VSSGLISCTSLLMTLLIFIACPPLFIYPHHITLGLGILFMTLQVDEVSAVLVSLSQSSNRCPEATLTRCD